MNDTVNYQPALSSPDSLQPLASWMVRDARPRHAFVVIVLLTAVLLLPFINKAYHMDDTVFLKMARQIVAHPLDPYGFSINWYGQKQPMFVVMDNPPLASYYIAAVASCFGWSEPILHTAFFPFALAVVLGTAFLAHRAGAPPVLAALACLCSPLFLVSSSNIMCDTMMAAFFVWSLVLWIDGIERKSYPRLWGAVLLAALGAMTKYYGMSVLPLMAAYAVIRTRRFPGQLFLLALPIMVLLGYELWTSLFYGRGLLTSAARAAGDLRWTDGRSAWTKGVIGLSFAGAAMPCALFLAPRLLTRLQLAVCVFIPLAAVLLLVETTPRILSFIAQQHQSVIIGEMILLAISGVSMLVVASLQPPFDPLLTTLQLWVGGTFTYCTFVNWTINGPPMMLLLPPAAVLFSRRFLARGAPSVRWTAAALAGAAMLSLAVCWGDYGLASAGRKAADQIMNILKPKNTAVWFQGHWGFQYYMEEGGAKALDRGSSILASGDSIVMPANNSNVLKIKPVYVANLQTITLPANKWVTTMNCDRGAGFYSYLFGPVPFVFGRIPLERYEIVTFNGESDY